MIEKYTWISLLDKDKSNLDLSSIDIDGSHATALRGGGGAICFYKKLMVGWFYLVEKTVLAKVFYTFAY